MADALVKALVTVGGAGYVPKAPGTVGSLAGVAAAMAADPWVSGWPLLVMLAGGMLLTVPVMTQAERIFGRTDPSQVVLDEFWAMWAVFAACPIASRSPGHVAAAFVLFRAFDIMKPPPCRWLDRAPGGWGILLDDLGAAAYVCLILCASILLP